MNLLKKKVGDKIGVEYLSPYRFFIGEVRGFSNKGKNILIKHIYNTGGYSFAYYRTDVENGPAILREINKEDLEWIKLQELTRQLQDKITHGGHSELTLKKVERILAILDEK